MVECVGQELEGLVQEWCTARQHPCSGGPNLPARRLAGLAALAGHRRGAGRSRFNIAPWPEEASWAPEVRVTHVYVYVYVYVSVCAWPLPFNILSNMTRSVSSPVVSFAMCTLSRPEWLPFAEAVKFSQGQAVAHLCGCRVVHVLLPHFRNMIILQLLQPLAGWWMTPHHHTRALHPLCCAKRVH